MESNVSHNEMEEFLKKGGKRAAQVLSILGKQQQFLKALSTPIGQELLRDILEMMEERLEKIVKEDADEGIRAEYRVLRTLAGKWRDRVNSYYDGLKKVKGGK